MAAEIYVSVMTGFGLGQVMHFGREDLRTEQVFAIMFVIVAIGLTVDRAVFAPIERMLHRKWGTGPAKA
jgi:NitT/TauT family transport system permease protein